MNLVTSLSIERVTSHHSQFWPHGAQQLVVTVWQPDRARDLLVAYVIDPGPTMGHGRSRIFLEAELQLAKLSSFIKAVIDSVEGDIRHHCHKITTFTEHHEHHDQHHDELAIADPRQIVRKTSLALAASLRAEERLAETVVNPSSTPKPPREQVKAC